MFGGRARDPHPRSPSTSTNAAPTSPLPPRPTTSEAPISPLQMTFDFELPNSSHASDLASSFSPVSPESAPKSPPLSDGRNARPPSARKPHGGLQLMPHIPATAVRSNSNSARRIMAGEAREAGWNAGDSLGRPGGTASSPVAAGGSGTGGTTTLARSKSVLSARLSSNFEPTISMDYEQEPMPLSRTPLSGTQDERPKTAHGNGVGLKMEASLFPQRAELPSAPQTPPATMPSMNRSFIDSRDKPYSQPTRPFTLQSNHSSPNLSPNAKTKVSTIRGPTPIYSNRMISPQVSAQDLSQQSNYSGSTARPSTRASSKTVITGGPSTTIGTPYAATADSFPLPQHVKTRPKTAGVISSVAGVTVPTHHTSSIKPTSKSSKSESRKSESRKSEVPKKKGRLLNPIFLLQRRRSSQDPDAVEAERATREAQAQAVARQKHVLASGVNIPPPDFDPRIRGKVVHDFSAPREKRNTFDEANGPQSPNIQSSPYPEQPMSPSFPPRHASLVNRGTRDAQRRSTHTPVFRENLDENPETSKRISSIQAENLENKEFLQRASKHSHATAQSQESAVLPPFARRSQMLDPMQASHFRDDDSNRSSDPTGQLARTSSSTDVGEISPVTAHSSGHDPISPISDDPTSPLGSRPVSHLNTSLAQGSHANENRSPGMEPQHWPSNDKTSRPYSTGFAAPQFDTITEASVDNSPIEPAPRQAPAQEPKYLAHGISIKETANVASAEISDPTSTGVTTDASVGVSNDQSPRTSPDDTATSAQGTPLKFVEKRKSAVGHSRKSSTLPRKHASNASRFSFQFGESAAEEQALEEKHRKIASREITHTVVRGNSPDEDDEDFFDEDAMDDMDELEMQASSDDVPYTTLQPPSKPGDGSISKAGTSQSSLYLQQARQVLRQPESDDGSIYDDDEMPQVTDERDIPYADHPAFRAHDAMVDSRHTSMAVDGYWRDSTIDSYMRDSYYPQGNGSRTTLNTSSGQYAGYAQDYLSAIDRDSQRFSRPYSTLNVPGQAPKHQSTTLLPKPTLPHRDSGNSERNRAVSGFSFSTIGATPPSERADPMGDETQYSRGASSLGDAADRIDTAHPRSNLYLQDQPNYSASDLAGRPNGSSHTATSSNASSDLRSQRKSQIDGKPNATPLSSAADGAWSTSAGSFDNNRDTTSSHTNRNESTSTVSFASPSRSALSKQSQRSDRSSEDFARGGPDDGTSPTTPRDGHVDHIGFASMVPPTSKEGYDAQANPKSSTILPVPTGLGLSTSTDFDFGHQLSGMPLDTTIVDASDSEDELAASHPNYGQMGSFKQAAASAADKPSANVAEETSPQQPRPTESERHVASQTDSKQVAPTLSSAHTSPKSPTESAREKFRQNLHDRIDSSASINGRRLPSASSASAGNSMPVLPSASRNGTNHFPVKSSPKTDGRKHETAYDDNQDDMYFDDGNIGVDFGEPIPTEGGFNEDAFDDDSFLYRPNAAVNAPQGYAHRKQPSNLSYHSNGSDGPYPAFAMSETQKALARTSQLMAEDLPIPAPVDPKYIPQRNPSEDARRLGLSDRAPPAPISESDPEAIMHLQDSLQKYHAALAAAANRAAAEGRFVRQPSIASTVGSSFDPRETAMPRLAIDTHNVRDDVSMYSQSEDFGDSHLSRSNANGSSNGVEAQRDSLSNGKAHPPRIGSFDFGFTDPGISDFGDFGDYDDDDDLVAAANAEVLASDDEGFYGQEFQFYGRPRANSNEMQPVIGGYFGPDGDDGLQRNKSLREPNLTPITERSEFSTRNSFVAGMGPFGPHSPALSRMPITPLMEHDITSFDDLRRLRAQAFGGSGRSERSSSNRSSQQSFHVQSPGIDTNVGLAIAHGHPVGSPMQYGYSNGSSTSSNTSNVKPLPIDTGFNFHDSPQSATSSNGNSFALDVDATPKRNTNNNVSEPVTAKKIPPRMMSPTSPKSSHSRSGSGADSINYVRESDPESGRPRWVLERRRTSEQDGQLELVGRELVQGGWI
ncbi:hypothetical protein CKM354_000826000 [Cercospora kikuchii]|uniref:Uncharacterized protein n=1 Tax=Cercospora kikuchii TaxID=84275 RepID=A0A9P3FF52_9PEZI|nr:uncharacterized protein CKM354_000826000 [Cercospora kikuchii]GIZ45076.1 hypothetical protein CKM354_000826000 [Cercospora kikuchii]